jgi:hypothetical protein
VSRNSLSWAYQSRASDLRSLIWNGNGDGNGAAAGGGVDEGSMSQYGTKTI